jgi:hypothetical protein
VCVCVCVVFFSVGCAFVVVPALVRFVHPIMPSHPVDPVPPESGSIYRVRGSSITAHIVGAVERVRARRRGVVELQGGVHWGRPRSLCPPPPHPRPCSPVPPPPPPLCSRLLFSFQAYRQSSTIVLLAQRFRWGGGNGGTCGHAAHSTGLRPTAPPRWRRGRGKTGCRGCRDPPLGRSSPCPVGGMGWGEEKYRVKW